MGLNLWMGLASIVEQGGSCIVFAEHEQARTSVQTCGTSVQVPGTWTRHLVPLTWYSRDVPEPERNGFYMDYSYRNGLDRNRLFFGPERNGSNRYRIILRTGTERFKRNGMDWTGMDQKGTNSLTGV